MLDDSADNLSQAILHTVAYSDIFDYPLTAHEIHRYLSGIKISFEEVLQALEESPVARTGDYFTLPGREDIVSIRAQREARSRELLPRAIQYGRVLGTLPYVRMAALTGSLAVMNVSKMADFDYMLVTVPGRLWTARAFAVTFGRMMRPFGDRICVNLLVSENALAWPEQDLYSAREMCQMIPIAGIDVYHRLRAANSWTESILPNSTMATPNLIQLLAHSRAKRIQHLLELPFRGKGGGWLEQRLMKFQLHHIAQHWGTGDEANFSADVCQSNFHDHRKWTWEVFKNRLIRLEILLAVGEG